MSPVLFAFLISLFAGLSTALGGLLPFFPKASDKRVLCFSLGLSAGVMVYISFMELMGEAIDGLAGLYGDRRAGLMALGFFVLGMLVIALIDHLVPEEENPHEFGGGDDRKLGKMGILSALAIAVHNFPEGLASFMSALTGGLPLPQDHLHASDVLSGLCSSGRHHGLSRLRRALADGRELRPPSSCNIRSDNRYGPDGPHSCPDLRIFLKKSGLWMGQGPKRRMASRWAAVP